MVPFGRPWEIAPQRLAGRARSLSEVISTRHCEAVRHIQIGSPARCDVTAEPNGPGFQYARCFPDERSRPCSCLQVELLESW